MALKKIGEISNTQHGAHPLIVCDAKASYGGWAEHEAAIVDGNVELALGSLRACIADGGQHGHVDVFAEDGRVVLVNDEREPADPAELAQRSFDELAPIATVDVPNGTLAIGIAYHPLNHAGDPGPADREHMFIDVAPRAFVVRATEGDGGWRIELRGMP